MWHQLLTLGICIHGKQKMLVVYHLVFSHQQAQGHKQHNPQRVRNTAEMSTKHPAVLREDVGLVQNDKQ